MKLYRAKAYGDKPANQRDLALWLDDENGKVIEFSTDCEHFRRKHMSKVYFKCAAEGGRFLTGGPGSDIRASDPACSLYTELEP